MPVLYLIPTLLSENTFSKVISPYVITVIHSLKQFVVEDIRTARRFISKSGHPLKIEQLSFHELNEHTKIDEIAPLLPYLQNFDTGVISDAGVPGVADPGAAVVRLAHENGIKVIPLVGPSSILMALMASGLNGQSFAFNGYLPIKQNERQSCLRDLEHRSLREQQTQIFIETPYRNMQLLEDILKCCKLDTLLTIAANITAPEEFILTKRVQQWKRKIPELNKIPVVFLLLAEK